MHPGYQRGNFYYQLVEGKLGGGLRDMTHCQGWDRDASAAGTPQKWTLREYSLLMDKHLPLASGLHPLYP